MVNRSPVPLAPDVIEVLNRWLPTNWDDFDVWTHTNKCRVDQPWRMCVGVPLHRRVAAVGPDLAAVGPRLAEVWGSVRVWVRGNGVPLDRAFLGRFCALAFLGGGWLGACRGRVSAAGLAVLPADIACLGSLIFPGSS